MLEITIREINQVQPTVPGKDNTTGHAAIVKPNSEAKFTITGIGETILRQNILPSIVRKRGKPFKDTAEGVAIIMENITKDYTKAALEL